MDEEKTDANDESDIFNWSKEDNMKLVQNLQERIPPTDNIRYSSRMTKIDWSKVAFKDYTADECKQQWQRIMHQVRLHRTLSEVCADAIAVVENPSDARRHKLKKRTSHSSYPDFPKQPMPPIIDHVNKQYRKLKEANPEISREELEIRLRQDFEQFSPEKKVRLKAKFDKKMEEFKAAKAVFYQNHPELQPRREPKRRELKRKAPRPKLPKSAFAFYCDTKVTPEDPPEMSKERIQHLKAKWEGMKEKRKLKYIEQAMDDEKRYQEELEKFQAEHPHVAVKNRKMRVSKAEKKLFDNSLGRPVKPPQSAYMLFCKEFHQRLIDTGLALDPSGWMKNACSMESFGPSK